jgi:hypothetical protein
MTYASTSDVQTRLGRPLTTDEATQVDTLLDDAEVEIRSRIPDLDTRAADPDYLQKVVKVEASAVARLIRNPDGYTSESDGTYTYQINYRLTSGELTITAKEWSQLGIGAGAFSINVSPRRPRSSWLLQQMIAQIDPMYDIPGEH